jgi:hypothetical protein
VQQVTPRLEDLDPNTAQRFQRVTDLAQQDYVSGVATATSTGGLRMRL